MPRVNSTTHTFLCSRIPEYQTAAGTRTATVLREFLAHTIAELKEMDPDLEDPVTLRSGEQLTLTQVSERTSLILYNLCASNINMHC